MKKNTSSLFIKLSIQQVTDLTTIVNESFATGFAAPKTKIFSTADLWAIQRSKKAVGKRRFAL